MVPASDQTTQPFCKPRLSGPVLTLMKVIRPPSLKFKTKPPITPFKEQNHKPQLQSLLGMVRFLVSY